VRCRTCGYSLWNLAVRQCPECGTSFRPSDFEFVPGTVRFSCPHCRCDYYGTGDRGQLSPRAFSCEQCGAAIDMDGMLLRPAEGLSDADTEPGVMPWLERRRRGLVKSYLGTVGLALVRPARLMRGVPQSASVGEALVFGVATSALAFLIGSALPSVGYWGWTAFVWGWTPEFWEVFWLFVWLVFALFMVTGIIPIWALFAHGVLRLTGGSRYTVDRTLQALGYSAGANVLSVIPLIGPVLGWLWWSISAVAMVSSGQKVKPVRGFVAVYALPLVLVLVGLGAAGLATWWARTTLTTGPGGQAWSAQQFRAEAVHNGVLANAFRRDGVGPPLALDLIPAENLATWTHGGPVARVFCHPDTMTTLDDIPVGDGTLRTFSAMSPARQRETIRALVAEMPDNVIAHRVGDYVFTYHGATLYGRDPKLWVVVMLPDPDVNGVPNPSDMVLVGTGAYRDPLVAMDYSDLADELEAQNDYRATLGLPPLPDLLTVTHGNPAVGE
jgi:hypothetical protein